MEVIETHSALVFLAGPLVYKIKKAVNLGFLDFSTLAQRHHFCRREVELNQRLCRGVYLGVSAITVARGGYRWNGRGRVVEYAVVMRKLSSRYFLNHLLDHEAVGSRDFDRIVRRLKEFYGTQEPSPTIEAWGRVAKLRISTEENFRQIRPFVGANLTTIARDVLRHYTLVFYKRRRRLFEQRVRDGWIRDGHGDLHLEHIHVTRRTLHIYDCIEFNDRFRYIDVANDVAFLAMDLDHRGRPDLAQYFEARMAKALGDDGMPKLMDFYKCYRAVVRGKVEGLQGQARVTPEEDRPRHLRESSRYFRLALRYAVAGSLPLVVVIMGKVASGKSTVARALGEELHWKIVSSDIVRKESAGLPLLQRTPSAKRRALYSARRTAQTYEQMLHLARREIKAGRSVILDATFSQRQQRDHLRSFCRHHKLRFRVIEMQADDEELRRRLRGREQDTEVISDARQADFAMLSARYEPLDQQEEGAGGWSIPCEHDVESVTKRVLGKLAEAQVAAMTP